MYRMLGYTCIAVWRHLLEQQVKHTAAFLPVSKKNLNSTGNIHISGPTFKKLYLLQKN
jgi:hypothetical protein